MRKPKQLFFRHDEEEKARKAAYDTGERLYRIVDKRSNNPTPRVYVLSADALMVMKRSPLWKRMWVAMEVA